MSLFKDGFTLPANWNTSESSASLMLDTFNGPPTPPDWLLYPEKGQTKVGKAITNFTNWIGTMSGYIKGASPTVNTNSNMSIDSSTKSFLIALAAILVGGFILGGKRKK
ncbi:MAG: hypothetical protein K9J13_13835 [Saprospiraceae bacterium]|nr:hypothetical protein [Saprospiraceae bacterium]